MADAERTAAAPKRSGTITRFVVWVLSAEFKLAAVGLFSLICGLTDLTLQEFSILFWRETPGTIVESHTHWLPQRKGSTGPPIKVYVRYCYEVDGIEYESTRVTTGETIAFYDIQQAAAFRQRFPSGAKTIVRYDRFIPSESTLIAERNFVPWIFVAIGLVALSWAVGINRSRRRKGEPPHVDVDVPHHFITGDW